jgi:lysophospholipid acyltransferase (LPLAT)-like uncharacterized protein
MKPVHPHGVTTRSRRWTAAGLSALARFLTGTLRISFDDPGHVLTPREGDPALQQASPPPSPVLLALWHQHLAFALATHRRSYPRLPPRRLAGLVSASRDGGLLAEVMRCQGITPIRGSSSRRGAQALLEIVRAARQGLDVAITPDGPRGPRHRVREGIITAAQLSGCPIVPVGFQSRLVWELHSWDRFQIPFPFGSCRVRVGPRIDVPRDLSADRREALRNHLEEVLHRINAP